MFSIVCSSADQMQTEPCFCCSSACFSQYSRSSSIYEIWRISLFCTKWVSCVGEHILFTWTYFYFMVLLMRFLTLTEIILSKTEVKIYFFVVVFWNKGFWNRFKLEEFSFFCFYVKEKAGEFSKCSQCRLIHIREWRKHFIWWKKSKFYDTF